MQQSEFYLEPDSEYVFQVRCRGRGRRSWQTWSSPFVHKTPQTGGFAWILHSLRLSFSSPSSKHSCSLPATIEEGFSVEGDNIQISICLELFKGGNLWSGLNHLEILRFQHIYSHFFSQRTYSTHSWSDSSYKHTNLLSVLGLSYILKKKVSQK